MNTFSLQCVRILDSIKWQLWFSSNSINLSTTVELRCQTVSTVSRTGVLVTSDSLLQIHFVATHVLVKSCRKIQAEGRFAAEKATAMAALWHATAWFPPPSGKVCVAWNINMVNMHETGIKALGTERQQLRYFSHVDSLMALQENMKSSKAGQSRPEKITLAFKELNGICSSQLVFLHN